jgi:hypothetical protein
MGYATTSVFDVLADEEQFERQSSRKALSLAHLRIENHLGRYLRAAVTTDEFDARMAMVQDRFAGYVAEACDEACGGNATHIASSLVDHYRVQRKWQPRVAEGKPPWLEDDEDEDDDGDRERDERHLEELDDEDKGKGKKSGFLAQADYPYDQQPVDPRDQRITDAYPPESRFPNVETEPYEHEAEGYHDESGYCPSCGNDTGGSVECPYCGEVSSGLGGAGGPGGGYGGSGGYGRAASDDASKLVTCPECGGDGKQAGVNKCGKCGGNGKVPNFGDSMLDAISKTADDSGNTDLGKPEPTMDKRKWTPQNLEQEPANDSERWPTIRKDPVEIIKAENREDEGHIPEEINTVTDVQTLKGTDSDSGFGDAKDGLSKGPSDWQGGNSQATPVTHETQS